MTSVFDGLFEDMPDEVKDEVDKAALVLLDSQDDYTPAPGDVRSPSDAFHGGLESATTMAAMVCHMADHLAGLVPAPVMLYAFAEAQACEMSQDLGEEVEAQALFIGLLASIRAFMISHPEHLLHDDEELL